MSDRGRTTNTLRRALERGEPVLGAGVTTLDPAFVEVYGALGLDFVWLDFENAGPHPEDATVVAGLARAADAAGIEPLVRLPSGDPSLVRKVLDTGIQNLLVPRVETAAEVRRAVEAARFRYDGGVGERGYAGARASGWGGDTEDYAARQDANVLVGVMIENLTAVDDVEEILAVPDLGFTFLGPSDLSVSAGHPLETDHPDVTAAIETVRDASTAAGVPVGRTASSAAATTAALDAGFDLVRLGHEVGATRSLLGDRLAAVRNHLDG
ncbi:aldolase/citrate lyase family protein [Salinirubellus salinus]|uniref:Aldolase/citrate lyase family protein n=1 Tax=Salinirubellus salinus TaxID=1364945 RepID=A0A9E7R2C6_9EURY|nr:aldolase/citrate lyase family protein [Salinirubellus salinus]UWM54434.1 aldolase/citrate lyase family protein [Salinirubellus salinus]